MASYNETNDVVGGHNTGWGMGGGLGGIILLLLFLGFLFKGHGGHGEGRHERNWNPDESNFEQSTWQIRDAWKHDVKACNEFYQTNTAIHAEADKTRALIREEAEKDLRDRLAEKDRKIQTLEMEKYTDHRFNQVLGAVDGLGHQFNAFACRQPVAPPQYFATRQNCTAPPPLCGPTRGGCDFGGGDFV